MARIFPLKCVMIRFKRCLLLAFLLAGWSLHAQPNRQPFLYKVSGNGLKEVSYLFGTYHLLGNSYLDAFPSVMRAFKEAKGVVIEVRLSQADPYRLAPLLLMHDNSLSAMLDTAAYEALSNDLHRFYGIRLQELDQMKPAMVSTMLMAAYAREWDSTVNQFKGKEIDAWFELMADSLKKTVTPLESVDDQLKLLFLDTEESKQAEDLIMLSRNINRYGDNFRKMIHAYYMADLDSLWAGVQDEVRDSMPMGAARIMLDDRNNAWMQQLPSLMRGSSQFVAVGAAHLAGPSGLVAALRRQGYNVEPLRGKEVQIQK
jgi:uncharacterized protein YbaP (TraB family)